MSRWISKKNTSAFELSMMQISYDDKDWDQHSNRRTKHDLNQKVFSYLALFEDSWDIWFELEIESKTSNFANRNRKYNLG